MMFAANPPPAKHAAEFVGVPWIGKPASIEALLDSLDGLTASAEASLNPSTRALTL
jgi:hypothetical protein